MADTKIFHIGDILSITTGKLLSVDEMDGIYDIMGFLTGNNGISTIGLITFKDYATDVLLKQFPQLSDVIVPETVNSRETVKAFLVEMEAKFGKMHIVTRSDLPSGEKPGIKSDLETLKRIRPEHNHEDGTYLGGTRKPEDLR